MAYNHGKAERRWRLWKEKEEKILRECGVDEETIEEIRTFDRALLTVDKRTLQIVLLKMQGYSLKEIAPMVDLSAGAVYARLDHLRKKLRKLL